VSIASRYRKLQERTAKKGWPALMSIVEFEELVMDEVCHWCGGAAASGDGSAGLDRIDNSVGYVVGNVVACCFTCNRERGTLTYEEYQLVWLFRRNKASAYARVERESEKGRARARMHNDKRSVPWKLEIRRRMRMRRMGLNPDAPEPPVPAMDDLRRWREDHRMTQRDAALRLGVSRKTVQRAERRLRKR
jgi:hypothetical protein